MAERQRPGQTGQDQMTTSESLSRSTPINQPPDHGQPQPPRPPGVQSTDSPAPQQTGSGVSGQTFDIIRQKMAEVRQAAMQVENSSELATYLEKLAMAESAMMELEIADKDRKQQQQDKENMKIGEDGEGDPVTRAVEADVRAKKDEEEKLEKD